jgi:tetratricopeptide (TPR) repeat protein
MARFFFLMLTIIAGALALGVYLLPNPDERYSAFLRDGKYEDALAELDSLAASGDQREEVTSELYQLYVHFGDTRKATLVLEKYATQHPDSADAQERLVEIYWNTQDKEKFLRALARLVEISPTQARVERLLAFYRLYSMYDREEDLLLRFQGAAYLSDSDRMRLARLLAVKGKLADATNILLKFDDVGDLVSQEDRLTLFKLLLDQGRLLEATQRSQQWLTAGMSSNMAAEIELELRRALNN